RLGDEVLTMKFGLENIQTLLKSLGDPQLRSPAILIAGTNGKGSVASFLNSVYTAAGIPNGMYTSPHLMRPEERIVVNGLPVEPRVWTACLSRVVEKVDQLKMPSHPTYFEILTATAFLCFVEQGVELVILEVGMGGRLDSTNVVEPVLSILTPVGLDHQAFLGETLEAVAGEKAGILHGQHLALMAPQKSRVQRVLISEAARKNVNLTELDASAIRWQDSTDGKYRFGFHGAEYRLSMHGRHQVENAALAIQAIELLSGCGFSVSRSSLTRGIEKAHCAGRIQVVSHDPTVVLDGAHNADALGNLVNFLKEHTREPRSLVFSIMKDKDITPVEERLRACFRDIYLTSVDSPRAASVEALHGVLPSGIPVAEPLDAYQRALDSPSETVVVAGSFYLVGEILKSL
ncbi:MAG: folylpolyglutamate synthase/dihydrofolate synthase family protein, partial [Acidobacteriota bacterium]